MTREAGYPRVMRHWRNSPQSVAAEEWMSQSQAAQRLNVNIFRIALALVCENLVPAEGPSGRAGVTVRSVEDELEWRAQATWTQRVRRAIRTAVLLV